MKKAIIISGSIILAVFALMLAGCRKQEQAKKEIFDLVEANYDAIVAACEEKDADALCDIDGITKVDIVEGYVLVFCKGAGIAPSSQDYGFYYSEENHPVAVAGGSRQEILCDTEELTSQGNGYQYIDSGLNVHYTEQIKGSLYFYSNAY